MGVGGTPFSCETVPQNNFQLPLHQTLVMHFYGLKIILPNTLGTILGGIKFMAHFNAKQKPAGEFTMHTSVCIHVHVTANFPASLSFDLN